MRNSLLFFLSFVLVFLVGCGNPHLVLDKDETEVVDDQGINKLLQDKSAVDLALVDNEKAKLEIEVAANSQKDLLDFKTLPLNFKIHKTVIIKNITKSDLVVSFSLEKNKHFSFLGDFFRCNQVICEEKIPAGASLVFDIAFDGKNIGFFEDVFSMKATNKWIYKLSLRGERKSDEKSLVEDGPIISDKEIFYQVDFNEVALGSYVTKTINLKNPFDKNVSFDEIFFDRPNGDFKLSKSSTCGKIIKPGECSLNIVFEPTKENAEKGIMVLRKENGGSLTIYLKGKGVTASPLCQNSIYNLSAEENKMNKNIEWPYLFHSIKYKNVLLKELYGLAATTKIKGLNYNVVKDAQVRVDFNLNQFKNLELENISVKLNLLKIVLERPSDTEVICLSAGKFKRCSGRLFTSKKWKDLINPHFFQEIKAPVNVLYEDKLVASTYKSHDLNGKVISSQKIVETISFKDLFNLTKKDFNQLKNEDVVSLVLGDDTRNLNMPVLIIETKEKNRCLSQK